MADDKVKSGAKQVHILRELPIIIWSGTKMQLKKNKKGVRK